MENPTIVSHQEWLEARKAFLEKEKELTRLKDQLNQERMALPWEKVTKDYIFDGPAGKVSLSDLFDGRSQLLIQHFMMGPGWEEGCVGCSFLADHFPATLVHLNHHDVSFAAVSRAAWPDIKAFKQRMGWPFTWVSSAHNDFNFDYHVSFIEPGEVYYNYEMTKFGGPEAPGISVFYKDDTGDIFHTYSSYARGNEELLTTYVVLDLMPLGRNETGPGGNLVDWVKHHDKYDTNTVHACCCEKEGVS